MTRGRCTRALAFATLAISIAACAPTGTSAPEPASRYVSERCPLLADARPYTVVARADAFADQRFLHRVVRSVVREFQPRQPTLAAPMSIPTDDWLRNADFDSTFRRMSWRPGTDDRATLQLVLHGDGRWSSPRLMASSGNAAVARAALAAFDRALRAVPTPSTRDTLPRAFPVPARQHGMDSLVVTVLFGDSAHTGEQAVALFAVQEANVIPIGHVSPIYPANLRNANIEGDAIAQFVVDSTGAPDMGSFSARRGGEPLFIQAVRVAVSQQRLTTAQRDCRPVRQLVQQVFTFRLRQANYNPGAKP